MTCKPPAFQPQLLANYPLGGLSCTCFAGAMAGEYDTCGTKHPTGKAVRTATGDTAGGTSLMQVDDALRRGWGIDLDTRVGTNATTWPAFVAAVNGGRGAILQGGYSAIHGSRFSGSETFRGNHAIYVMPGLVAMDPLADGRRPGIYKFHGEAYPESMLREFASQLEIAPGRVAGMRVWCSLSRDNTSSWVASVRSGPRIEFKVYTVRTVAGVEVITGRASRYTKGFTATCTQPRAYRWPRLSMSKSLVKLTSGSRKGQYIERSYAKELP